MHHGLQKRHEICEIVDFDVFKGFEVSNNNVPNAAPSAFLLTIIFFYVVSKKSVIRFNQISFASYIA